MERPSGASRGGGRGRARGGGGWNGGNDGGGRGRGRGGRGGWNGGNEGGGRGRGGGSGRAGGRSPQQSYYQQQQYQQEPHPQNERRRSGGEGSRGGRGVGPRPQSYAGATTPPPQQYHRQEAWRNRNAEIGDGRPDQQVRVNPTSPPPPPADYRTSSSPPSGQSTDHNVSRMSSSPPAPVVDNPNNKIVPIKRPDGGGRMAMRRALLRVNHFPVKFNSETVIRQYDVDIKPTAPATNGKQTKLSKVTLRRIRDKLFADDPSEFPLAMTAYDGEKNIFSAVPLPVGKFKVEFDEADDMRTKAYTFSIKLVNELELCKLRDYLSGRLNSSIPRDILQGMDVVMKEHPVRHMISVGRSFHPFANNQNDDLGYGITASRGFQPSLKPTFQGVSVCLDYSVLSFRKRLPVLDFLREHIPELIMNDFGRLRRAVERVMTGLKVHVTHRVTKQKYLVAKLTEKNTRFLTFFVDDPDGGDPRQVSVVDYFRQKYQKEITHLDIPCLDLGEDNRINYVPMEFCVLVEGQIYPKENLDRDAAYILKNMSLATPQVRQNTINDMVRARDGPCGGDVIRNFGMEVSTIMTSVEGRVIGPPELKLGTPSGRPIKITVDREKCHWNLVGKGVVEGRPIERWAIIDFSSADRCRLNHSQFVPQLVSRCNSLGIPMSEPLFSVPATMNEFANADRLRQLLENNNDRALRHFKGRLQFVLCVMSRRDEGYKYLKWVSEILVGVVTQCCLSTSKLNDQYFANLALKINAKLGGSNVELSDRLPYFGGENHVMFIGADVNHPAARNKTSPSIAAVVATINWPAANRYAARVCPQNHRTEKILNFGDMCVELVQTYARLNKVKPEKIVVFRDGVSEGQFDMVLNEELLDLKNSFQSINYNPTITLIVAQKRHQTRLFPESERGWPPGNVAPGTVVDTKIVHPFEYDFYLCSHYGSLGTSKPTHYHVLWDEHSLSSDVLQKLIYNLCFTFARCTKPVSLVPPVYYADLAAFRGRMYHDAVEGQSPASSSSSRTSFTLSVASSMDDKSYKLHANLENNMFFV